MSNQRYPEEFKIQAVNQVTDKGVSCWQSSGGEECQEKSWYVEVVSARSM